ETLTLSHDGDGDLDKRGTLHILAIGVNDYKGLGKSCGEKGKESCNLDFAGGDARTLADAVEKRLGPGHEWVDKRVLVNGGNPKDAPTAANITDAVERLRLAKETDTVVLFISGHGKNDGPDYRFLVGWRLAGLDGGAVADAARRDRGCQGSAHPVHRHVPLRQRLQPAPRQRRLPRQHRRLHRGAVRPGGP